MISYRYVSVLHLGNIYFHRKQLKHGQEGVEIGSEAEIKWTSHLLEIDTNGIRKALTTKTTVRPDERPTNLNSVLNKFLDELNESLQCF